MGKQSNHRPKAEKILNEVTVQSALAEMSLKEALIFHLDIFDRSDQYMLEGFNQQKLADVARKNQQWKKAKKHNQQALKLFDESDRLDKLAEQVMAHIKTMEG